jgi:hypothetical protein
MAESKLRVLKEEPRYTREPSTGLSSKSCELTSHVKGTTQFTITLMEASCPNAEPASL